MGTADHDASETGAGAGPAAIVRAVAGDRATGLGPLLQTLTMRDQNDPELVYTLVVFESEEKARAREQDPRRQEGH